MNFFDLVVIKMLSEKPSKKLLIFYFILEEKITRN